MRDPYKRASGRREHEHVVVVERVLGHKLPNGAQVHHVDRDPSNNDNGNLVACQDASYHRLLHKRQEALDACGDPRKRMCKYCRYWDSTDNMVCYDSSWRHRKCHNDKRLAEYRAKKGVA